jgi:hypothetical protein
MYGNIVVLAYIKEIAAMNPRANDAENVHKSPPPPPIHPRRGEGGDWRGGVGDVTTEAASNRELVQYGILPSLAGGECSGKRGLYCDGRSIPPALMIRTVCPGRGCSAAIFWQFPLLLPLGFKK